MNKFAKHRSPLYSETFTVGFGNLYSETSPLDSETVPAGFENFSHCIWKLLYSGNLSLETVPLDSETVPLDSETFPLDSETSQLDLTSTL